MEMSLCRSRITSRTAFFLRQRYAAYQTEPNFQSNVGPENVVADHFDTIDIFSLTYHWSTRFSMITSYTFKRVQYESSSMDLDRCRISRPSQNTLSEQLQFSLTSRTNLVGEYRFETIDYDTAPTDSTTHFISPVSIII